MFNIFLFLFVVRDSWGLGLVTAWQFCHNVVIIFKFCLLMDSWNISNQSVDYQNHIPQTSEDDAVDAVYVWL